ncbi:MAG: hypothetical protein ACHQXA_01340 [Gemmatimonadales bacterium]
MPPSVRRSWPLLLLLAGGCVTARLLDVWKDPNYPSAPLNHILVVSLAQTGVARRTWEDALVAGLRDHGVIATASYETWPTSLPDTTALAAEVQRQAYDGVILTHPAETDTQRTYVHGATTVVPKTAYDPWKHHYVTYYARIHQPGYVETSTSLQLDTDVWMAADEFRMIWTATTRAINTTSVTATNKAIIGAILPNLTKQGIIPPAKPRA